jgi:DNA-binding PadR family transcriptional regulator
MSAIADQQAVLQYLYRRLASGETRYCTIATIRKATGLNPSNQYILALTDDLEAAGLVITRQAYQISGGRLFQITAAGFDAVQKGEIPARADSATWTGRFHLSEHQKSEIRRILVEMRFIITSAKLSNARTANAMALIESAEKLIETPDPLWPEIMRLLRSPTLAGVTGIAGLVLAIAQILMAAASS